MLYDAGIPEELAKIGVWCRLRTERVTRLDNHTGIEMQYFPKEVLEDLNSRYKKGLSIIEESGIAKELEKMDLYIETHAWG